MSDFRVLVTGTERVKGFEEVGDLWKWLDDLLARRTSSGSERVTIVAGRRYGIERAAAMYAVNRGYRFADAEEYAFSREGQVDFVHAVAAYMKGDGCAAAEAMVAIARKRQKPVRVRK